MGILSDALIVRLTFNWLVGCRRTKQSASSSGAGHPTSGAAAAAGDFPALRAANGLANGHGAGNSGDQASGAGKKAKKVPKFERLRLTGGDPAATAAWLDTSGGTKTKPQNVWTQGRPAVAGGGGPQPRGSWAAKDKLAKEWRGINDAWDKE